MVVRHRSEMCALSAIDALRAGGKLIWSARNTAIARFWSTEKKAFIVS